MHIHTTFCIFLNGPKKSGYDSTYYILHFSISRFGLHTTFYICDFECLLKLHTTFYIFDFRPGTYIRHLHLPVGEVNRAASTFYIWRVNNMRANSYTYYIPDPAYIRPALSTSLNPLCSGASACLGCLGESSSRPRQLLSIFHSLCSVPRIFFIYFYLF